MENLSMEQIAEVEGACGFMQRLKNVIDCPVTISALDDGAVEAIVRLDNDNSCSISVNGETVIRRYIRRGKTDA